jgi:DNA-binding NarL/FixJ family response regulator
MDIDMPGISGIEAVRSIRASYPSVKVLMQTVFEGNDKIFAAICAGASGYLLKKSSPSRILDAIRETHQGGAPMTGVVAHKLMEIIRQQAPPQSNPEFIDLSAREKEILALLVQGRSYKSVAAECHISIDTVNTHVRHIYEKLQVHSKSEAVAKAIHQKLV